MVAGGGQDAETTPSGSAVGRQAQAAYRRNDALARQGQVERYLPLVKHVAARLAMGLPPQVDLDDLISYGVFGLLEALERFDPGRGVKFETFAYARIKGAILDGLRAMDWVPASVRHQAKVLEEVYGRLEARLGRPATDEEVAAELGMGVAELQRALAAVERMALVSLDEIWPDASGENYALGELLADDASSDPAAYAEWRNRVEVLARAIDALPERERLVIALYYYEGLTVREVAEVLRVSVSRVSQLHTRAILRLRGRIAAEQRSLL